MLINMPTSQLSLFDTFQQINELANDPFTKCPYPDDKTIETYFKMADKYSHALLLYRIGEFYIALGDNAKKLNTTLKSKLDYFNDGILFDYVPAFAIDSFLPKLVKAGYKVALCDLL